GFCLVAAEVGFHEVDFGLYRRQVFLRSALQDETLPQLGQIGDAGYIQEYVFRQHSRQASENLFSCPALALEVDDIGLHEYSAAVTKNWHLVGGKCDIGVLL